MEVQYEIHREDLIEFNRYLILRPVRPLKSIINGIWLVTVFGGGGTVLLLSCAGVSATLSGSF